MALPEAGGRRSGRRAGARVQRSRRGGLLLVLAGAGALAACTPGAALDGPSVYARPVALDRARPQLDRVGQLRLEAAYALTSRDAAFGGFSGLWLAPDGGRMIAASDGGRFWLAELQHTGEGRLAGLSGWRSLVPGRLAGDPAAGNAEALSQDGAGGLVVAYEGEHRLRRLSLDDLEAPAAALPVPERLRGHRNQGIEALATLADGSLLALAEGLRDEEGDLHGWRIGPGGEIDTLSWVTSDGFVPTGADRLGDDIYVVERRFSLLGGFAARLVRVAAAEIRPGARLKGEVLALLQPPLLTDNFEAIVARHAPDGRILLYILSDDNFIPLQQTLLLQFAVLP